MPPSIDVPEASSEDAIPAEARRDVATPKTQLKNAVQSRYFTLLEEGSTPNAAAALAIRDVGKQAMHSSDGSSDDAAPRHLRFEEDSPVMSLSPNNDALLSDVSERCEENSPLLPQEELGSTSAQHEFSSSAPGCMQSSSSAPHLQIGSLCEASDPLQPSGIRGGRGSPPAGHRNKDVWKTFGIHLPAGRLLKNLYGGGRISLDPVPRTLKQSPPRSLGPPSELDAYMAVNNLTVGTPGLQYRKSMNIFDICKGGQEFVRWGHSVEGYRVDAAWLQVGDRYLPTTVVGKQVLKRWQGSEALKAEGLQKQKSLPPLRKLPRVKSSPQLSVGGVSYSL